MNKAIICGIPIVAGILFGMYEFFSELNNSRKRCSYICPESGKDEKILPLDCGHGFHPSCIHAWQKVKNKKCPLCEKDLK